VTARVTVTASIISRVTHTPTLIRSGMIVAVGTLTVNLADAAAACQRGEANSTAARAGTTIYLKRC
jgi:hypothetical protein